MDDTAEPKKKELWTEMMKSMIHFTETSTALINRMQSKLGVPDNDDIESTDVSDPFQRLKRMQEQLGLNTSESSYPEVCKCTPSKPMTNDSESNEEISIGIEYYKQPRPLKKKKFKYPPNLESKILAQRKKLSFICNCEGEGRVQDVDCCLCDNIPKRSELGDYPFPLVQCSSIDQFEISNIQCEKETKKETTEDETNSEQREGVRDSLAWIQKPGTYDPNELPQDCSNPFIVKGQNDSEIIENLLGFELFTAMKNFGGNIAQIDSESGEKETYDQFLEKCRFVAVNLRKILSSDDIVGLMTSNHINSFVPFLAALFNGNRVATYDRLSTQAEMSSCLHNVTPKIMFVSTNSFNHLKESMKEAQVDFRIVVFGDGEDHESFSSYLNGDSEEEDNFQVHKDDSPDSTAAICFSGNEVSKAVCLSHRALLRQSIRMIGSDSILPVILDFSENCNILSLLFTFCSILNGGKRIIAESFEAGRITTLINEYKVKIMNLHPHQCTELSSYLEPKDDVSPLFCLFTGGERINPKVVKRLKEQLMGCLICQVYEKTELTGPVVLFNLSDAADLALMYCTPQACGKSLDGCWYKIVDSESGNILSHSSTGELFVKSKMISNGCYVNNTEIKEEIDWFKTGDLAYYDCHGCFYIVNRIDRLIKYQNNSILPSKLEDILMSHPAVETAVVIGVPHAEDGQIATGLVTLLIDNENVNSKDLEEFLNKQIADNEKLNGGLKIIKSIPYNNHGKIKHTDLLNLFLNEDLHS